MDEKRNKIDEIDNQIWQLLNERFKVTKEIGMLKKEQAGIVLDPNREQAIIDRITNSELEHEQYVIAMQERLMELSKDQQCDLV